MMITMLEAGVSEDQSAALVEAFAAATETLPPFIVESHLLRAADGDVWRIATKWASREALDEYRASVETPEGVLMFRAAGAEPELSVFEVAAHATHGAD